jgi:hypothetical protein
VVLNYLRAGNPTPAGFSAARAEYQKRVAELTARLKRTCTSATHM